MPPAGYTPVTSNVEAAIEDAIATWARFAFDWGMGELADDDGPRE
ncbi:hypothetical protein [Devosia sp.]|jgi:hypothetical protein